MTQESPALHAVSEGAESAGKSRLFDGCCCAGGAAKGYHDAGFDVTGFDVTPQPRYPFTFSLADVLDLDAQWIAANFDAAHVSPPCQAHSDLQKQSKRFYRDLIPPVRELLEATGLPYVIENVEGAPLRDPVMLCGTMFPGLRVIRHRLFETNWPLVAPPHGAHPLVFTHDKRKAHHGKLDQDVSFVQVTGGGNCTVANARSAMGIDWMTKDELNEAIPPAYTEWIGAQLLAEVRRRRSEVAALCCRHLPDGTLDGPCTWPETDCYENGPKAGPQPLREKVSDA